MISLLTMATTLVWCGFGGMAFGYGMSLLCMEAREPFWAQRFDKVAEWSFVTFGVGLIMLFCSV